jgi:hypothetical protein
MDAERQRLAEAARHEKHWYRWGPYLAERAWGNPREDYSPAGEAWDYFPHDHARSRAYRWTEDGIAGICDNHQRLCLALALWNGRDPILKERLFGLGGNEGNHGEDVKEYYFYLDATPTNSWLRCLYKYPQAEYPYARLAEENRRRGRGDPEFELLDTGALDQDRYFDIFAEYAKGGVDDVLARFTVVNRSNQAATLHLMPTLWFRNLWSFGRGGPVPELRAERNDLVAISEPTLGSLHCWFENAGDLLFTDNETNFPRLFGMNMPDRHFKDAFHEYLVNGNHDAPRADGRGTKCCAVYRLVLQPGESRSVRLRLSHDGDRQGDFESAFAARRQEADQFYAALGHGLGDDARAVQRQAFAGLIWSRQYYHFVVERWLDGDPGQPAPPEGRKSGRDHEWTHLYSEDVISMPDKWEYPWFAAWDLAFHMIPFALIDADFAKRQLGLLLREWYMHPNGQIPAYEWAFSDVNPPVHAWAAWRVYKIDQRINGQADHAFLESVFHKLLMNFTWWVNRKDSEGNNIFEGGFLGLDNIGVFDRSKPLPVAGFLEQSDGTSWMAMYSLNMLTIALELAQTNPAYEDIASKFFEHFLYIAAAMNAIDGSGLWDPEDGFFYDRIKSAVGCHWIRVRSMVGLIPLCAVDTLEPSVIEALPGFKKRMQWFIDNRPDLCGNLASMTREGQGERRLLALVSHERFEKILARMLDEAEFLSPFGIRSLSRYHLDHPYQLTLDGSAHSVNYEPAESSTHLFGGNSNWRGPVWFPANYLLVEALQRFHHYHGDDFKVEFPTGSGHKLSLGEVAAELSRRLSRLFLRGDDGTRPVFGGIEKFQHDPNFRDYIPFHEYFHGDNGAGLGASHQTGWTALVAKLLEQSGE